jgi:glutamate racemase
LRSLDDSLPAPNDAPIGVFDSGVGGLTVLKALEAALPHERFIYLGDTARLPYGTKSPGTVQRYAVQAAHALVQRGVKALVIACNTASAVALDALRDAYRPLPVFGVVDPGAEAACRESRNGRIAVIATESTVRGGAYQRAILSRRPDARVLARPCPLLVSLAEEGWIDGDVPERVVDAYLGAWLHEDSHPDCLLLGCTHFPILAPLMQRIGGPALTLVDSAATTAIAVSSALAGSGLASSRRTVASGADRRTLLASDGRERFARVGRHFLGEALTVDAVELVDL